MSVFVAQPPPRPHSLTHSIIIQFGIHFLRYPSRILATRLDRVFVNLRQGHGRAFHRTFVTGMGSVTPFSTPQSSSLTDAPVERFRCPHQVATNGQSAFLPPGLVLLVPFTSSICPAVRPSSFLSPHLFMGPSGRGGVRRSRSRRRWRRTSG